MEIATSTVTASSTQNSAVNGDLEEISIANSKKLNCIRSSVKTTKEDWCVWGRKNGGGEKHKNHLKLF